jgi:hypothetical protein
MQITLTIPDKNAKSFLDVLRHISFVEIQQSVAPKKQPKKKNEEEFYEGIKRAVHEVNEAIAGRKQPRTLKEFHAELRD